MKKKSEKVKKLRLTQETLTRLDLEKDHYPKVVGGHPLSPDCTITGTHTRTC